MATSSQGNRRAVKVSWATYRESIGDRSPLFAEVARAWAPKRALYAGSYVDLSPATAIPAVTFLDMDRRAAKYFAESDLVASELEGRVAPKQTPEVDFVQGVYTAPLDVPEQGFDLLISLYAGPVWDHCQQYLVSGGLLLANTSHGDASIAALDPRLTLVGVVQHRDGVWTLSDSALDEYLIPKKPALADADLIRADGRGLSYTKRAWAYLFQLE
ncbi:hypothetical protein [Demequina oxidasica]|uniref:hypothetical protein n=1 Tax=Demequina oxidasica TaxID=676199 RepID=UPI000781091B|nr:hypothetical protein [Demequina oxidasica]